MQSLIPTTHTHTYTCPLTLLSACFAQVRFDRTDGNGFILNTLSDSDRGLQLSFTFCLTLPGVAAGSDAERERGEAMRGHYCAAVASTLARVREMVQEGKI